MSLDELPDFHEENNQENSADSEEIVQGEPHYQPKFFHLDELLSEKTLWLINFGYADRIRTDKTFRIFTWQEKDNLSGGYYKLAMNNQGQLLGIDVPLPPEMPDDDQEEYSFYNGQLPEDKRLKFIIGVRKYTKNKSAHFRGEIFFRTFYGDDWDINLVQLFEELRKTIDKQHRITKKKLDRVVYQAANEAIMKLRRPESIHIEDIADIPLEKVNPEYLKQENNGNGFRYHKYSLEQAKEIIRLVCLPRQIERWNALNNNTISEEKKKAELEKILPPSQAAIELLYPAYASIPQGKYYLTKYTKADGEVIEISRKRFSGFVTNDLKFIYSPPRRIEINMPDWTAALHILQDHSMFTKHPVKLTLDCRPYANFALWNDKPDYKEIYEDELRKLIEENWAQQAEKAGNKIHITATREQMIDLNLIPDANEFDKPQKLFDFITSFLDYRAPGKPWR